MSLLERLIEILAGRFLPDRSELREGRVRRRLVFLLEALIGCHNAYKAFRAEENEETYRSWWASVEDLVRILDNLRTTLSTVWPDAFDAVHAYAAGEDLPPPEFSSCAGVRYEADFGYRAMDRKEVARVLKMMEVLRSPIQEESIGDIWTATDRLKQAIKERLSEGEIHSAQQAFERGER